ALFCPRGRVNQSVQPDKSVSPITMTTPVSPPDPRVSYPLRPPAIARPVLRPVQPHRWFFLQFRPESLNDHQGDPPQPARTAVDYRVSHRLQSASGNSPRGDC